IWPIGGSGSRSASDFVSDPDSNRRLFGRLCCGRRSLFNDAERAKTPLLSLDKDGMPADDENRPPAVKRSPETSELVTNRQNSAAALELRALDGAERRVGVGAGGVIPGERHVGIGRVEVVERVGRLHLELQPLTLPNSEFLLQ